VQLKPLDKILFIPGRLSVLLRLLRVMAMVGVGVVVVVVVVVAQVNLRILNSILFRGRGLL